MEAGRVEAGKARIESKVEAQNADEDGGAQGAANEGDAIACAGMFEEKEEGKTR